MSSSIAAFDDPRFEPERLHAAARAILAPLEQVGNSDELVAVWEERFERENPRYGWIGGFPGRWWGARAEIRELEIVTVRNVGPTEPAEAVVRARLRIRRWLRVVPLLGTLARVLQRGRVVMWLTLLAAPGKDWELSRIDFDAAGEYHLAAEVVPEPVYDPALRDTAIGELAADDALAQPGELIVGTDAQELLDLTLADSRFAPAVIEAAVRSLIRAWRQMKIAGDDGFAALSSYEIAEYARDADLPASMSSIEVIALVADPQPAVFVLIAAVVQHRDGTRDHELCWKLELDDALEPQHWRLVDAYARPELRALRARPG